MSSCRPWAPKSSRVGWPPLVNPLHQHLPAPTWPPPPPQFNQPGLLVSPDCRVKGQREPLARFSRRPAPVWLITGLGLAPRLGALGAGWRPSVRAPCWPPPQEPAGLPNTAAGPPNSAGTCPANCNLLGPLTQSLAGPRRQPRLLLQDALMGMGTGKGWVRGWGGRS